MKTLELKYLAPYLPYKLLIYDPIKNKSKVMNLGQGGSNNWLGIKTVLQYSKAGSDIYKPILKPIKDVVKVFNQMDENERAIICHSEHILKTINLETEPYYIWQILLKYHFDVFGLIEQGLAIDINTIEK